MNKIERVRAGATGFILAPGYSLPTYAYPPLIRAARAESSKPVG